MDSYLDQLDEDRINGGYGNILDHLNELDCQEGYPEFDDLWGDESDRDEIEDFEFPDDFFDDSFGEGW